MLAVETKHILSLELKRDLTLFLKIITLQKDRTVLNKNEKGLRK